MDAQPPSFQRLLSGETAAQARPSADYRFPHQRSDTTDTPEEKKRKFTQLLELMSAVEKLELTINPENFTKEAELLGPQLWSSNRNALIGELDACKAAITFSFRVYGALPVRYLLEDGETHEGHITDSHSFSGGFWQVSFRGSDPSTPVKSLWTAQQMKEGFLAATAED